MGYTTDFEGSFELDKPLTVAQLNYLKKFNQTRRMKRDPELTKELPDPVREEAGLPVGEEGEFFVGDEEDFGQGRTKDIVDFNRSPSTQPGLWCQWTPSDDGMQIEWDYGEKFYNYIEWITYLIDNFLKPWGYVVNGDVKWYGEDRSDMGSIMVVNNKVTSKQAKIDW